MVLDPTTDKWFPAGGQNKSRADELATLRTDLAEAVGLLMEIASLGGNLNDERLTDASGPNDARQRGLMYCEARRLANAFLTRHPAPSERSKG